MDNTRSGRHLATKKTGQRVTGNQFGDHTDGAVFFAELRSFRLTTQSISTWTLPLSTLTLKALMLHTLVCCMSMPKCAM